MNENYTAHVWDKEGNWGMDENGDIKPLDDFSDFSVYKPDESASESASFKERNDYLDDVTYAVGDANRAAGAAKAMTLPDRFISVSHAERVSRENMNKARRIGKKACEVCPLFDECDIDSDILVNRLRDPKARGHFRKNVKKEENSDLCVDMLK